MLNVGVVGLGFMGMRHLAIYRGHPRTRLAAVADLDPGRLEKGLAVAVEMPGGDASSLGEHQIRGYATVEDLLRDTRLDLVSVCLPSRMHADSVCLALQSGKHVLCEKPMALNEADIDRMLRAATASPRMLMIGHCIRFWPSYRAAGQIVREGSLGRLVAAHFRRRAAFPAWAEWARDESQGGAVLDLAIHDIDFAIQLGGCPTAVTAVGTERVDTGLDYCLATLRFADATVTCEAGWCYAGDYPFSMDFTVYGERGMVCYDSSRGESLTLFRADGTSNVQSVDQHDAYWARTADSR